MKKAKMQLALDELGLDAALALAEQVRSYVDIIEAGTPLLLREGMRAVQALRNAFPEKEILADVKIMDAGEYEASIAFEAGADYCTVLGCTDLITIGGCLQAAQKYDRHVFVDMICVDDLAGRVRPAGGDWRRLHRGPYGDGPAGRRGNAAGRFAHA